ncbi:MAG: serine/threonine protein kinase [Flavobacteriales bacterium]|nr:serine/threonine protein kinase [Flavobacteriales bacterium]
MPDFERLERLGAGHFGEVWLVQDHALNVQRAVKFVPVKSVTDPSDFYNEPRALMELRHEHIVRVEDAGRLNDGTLYVAMEYLRHGSVEQVYRSAPIQLTKCIGLVKDVCWALEYAHAREFIHRDIKPGNVLIDGNNRGKLSDFGLATKLSVDGTASPFGYRTHLAPEVVQGGGMTKLSDQYALGLTAYRMINGDAFLPEVTDSGELIDMILAGTYPNRGRYRPYVPAKVQRIVNRCMDVDPSSALIALRVQTSPEGVLLHCDWTLRQKGSVVRYRARIGTAKYKVNITSMVGGRFSIETTKQIADGDVRRVKKDCFATLTLAEMKKAIRRVLQRYVANGS